MYGQCGESCTLYVAVSIMQDGDMAYDQTSGDVARDAGVAQATVQRYAREGLLEYETLSSGVRLFSADAAERVRELRRARRSGPRPRNGRDD